MSRSYLQRANLKPKPPGAVYLCDYPDELIKFIHTPRYKVVKSGPSKYEINADEWTNK